MAVTFTAVGSKGDDIQIQAPLMADRCMESSSGIAREKPVILFFLQTGEYCQHEEKACWQPTGQQRVATIGLNFPIFSVLI